MKVETLVRRSMEWRDFWRFWDGFKG